ncbi:ski2-like helicase [archaeon BMS3Bbin16]|nr:ski2-like helicase [archaeon BMS3Bbin16]
MEYKGFTLDRFQEEAAAGIESNYSVVVSAPTGSGKTLIADYIVDKHLHDGSKIIYTAPIKALSNQKYKDFKAEYGEENVGLLTGDFVENPGAPLLIMTTEIYRNMVLTEDPGLDVVSYVIFDEIHFINDVERGYVWEESIIFSKPNARFLCLSATIPNAEEFADWIRIIKRHEVLVVRHSTRSVPLHKLFYDYELGITTLKDIKEEIEVANTGYIPGQRGRKKPRIQKPSHIELIKEIGEDRLPCFFFVFSRDRCERNAVALSKTGLFEVNPKISTIVRDRLANAPEQIRSLKTTQHLRQALSHGVAFHHAGMLPMLKNLVEELFEANMIKVLYTTETFAVGINMPAKTVCFESLRKYDGSGFRYLNSKEYFQIAGRAGRRGIDSVGYAIAMIDRRDFMYKALTRMTGSDTLPIKSQFRLSVNTVLNLIGRHNPDEIDLILTMSLYSYQKKMPLKEGSEIRRVYKNLVKQLKTAGYVAGEELTAKGVFASQIYSDEILTGELFATDFHKGLSEYQIMLLIGGLCYEHKSRTEFYKTFFNHEVKTLLNRISSEPGVKRYRRLKHIKILTALLTPCYNGASFFEILKNTSMLEGDVIRFYRQMLDRIGQIRKATSDNDLISRLDFVQEKIQNTIADLDAI